MRGFESNKSLDTNPVQRWQAAANRDHSFHNQQLAVATSLQGTLKVSPPDGPDEKQADAVAEQIMRFPVQSFIQRQCTHCVEAKQLRRKPVSEMMAPFLQTKTDSNATLVAPGSLSHAIGSSKANGSAMDEPILSFMSARFGADFSDVKIHTGGEAERMSRDLNAKAFTVGSDIYFNEGQYQPGAESGKHLLAHELAHVLQQGAGQTIRRTPNPNPPPDPYIEGRPAHNHPPRGNWSAVQANARSECGLFSLRGRVECACAAMSPLAVLGFSRQLEMSDKPLAQLHLDHYLSGGGADYLEHTNLDNLMNTDAGARGVIAAAIAAGSDRGHVFLQQSDYSIQDFRYAFGGIDRVDYKVDRSTGTVDVWFKDRYDFHPAGFGHANLGTGDFAPPGRETNCVHAAAVEAKSSGAADFWMIGHATLPLSLFVPSASGGSWVDAL